MGFFSFQCRGCKKSIRSPHSYNEGEEWMNLAVCIFPNGTIVTGPYDGYGNIDQFEIGEPEVGDWWHNNCYVNADHPPFQGQSDWAPDQGYFIDDEEEEDE